VSTARRAAGTVLLTLLLMVAVPVPAWAHAGGLSPTGVRSVVRDVTPVVAGLTVTAIEDGARLRVRNDTGAAVEVPPGGGQAAPVPVPPGATVTWIDARATTLERDLGPAATQLWTVPVTAGAVPVTVTGEFVAEPPPVAPAWWGTAVAIGVGLFLLARRARRPHVLLAVAGTVAVLASAGHVVGATLAVESAPLWGTFLDATGIGLLVWPLVAVAAAAALRGSAGGVLGVCAGAGLSVVFILPDLTVFHFGVLPFAGPADLSRLLVAVVLGAGSAAAVAGAGALRALAETRPPISAELGSEPPS
jgi:hypothetical protein